jgi:hypothetical protein
MILVTLLPTLLLLCDGASPESAAGVIRYWQAWVDSRKKKAERLKDGAID